MSLEEEFNSILLTLQSFVEANKEKFDTNTIYSFINQTKKLQNSYNVNFVNQVKNTNQRLAIIEKYLIELNTKHMKLISDSNVEISGLKNEVLALKNEVFLLKEKVKQSIEVEKVEPKPVVKKTARKTAKKPAKKPAKKTVKKSTKKSEQNITVSVSDM